MTSRRFDLWQKAAALAPVLLLLVYLPGPMMLRCRVDGMLRPACCCPQESERQDSGPAVKAQDCCDREVAQSQQPAAEAARPADGDRDVRATISSWPAAVPLVTQATERFDWAWQRHGPERECAPIVLLKHAFLI
jgi:hypothetical protein